MEKKWYGQTPCIKRKKLGGLKIIEPKRKKNQKKKTKKNSNAKEKKSGEWKKSDEKFF